MALHWINGGGEYKQFVANRAMKIQEYSGITWRHVPTKENPADLGSRGGQVDYSKLWWEGPECLSDKEKWPTDIVTSRTPEGQAEAKITKELFNGATASTGCQDVEDCHLDREIHTEFTPEETRKNDGSIDDRRD